MLRRFSLWLALLLAAVLLAGAAPRAQADGPLALAFYYAWFDENSWSPDQVPDFPTPRYASRDRSTIERHVDQARGAGIDAFVQSWWGPGNPTDDNFNVLLDVAQSRGFRAAVDVELTSPFINGDRGAVVNALRHVMQTYVGRPAYLRWNGKPVIFFWRQNRLPVSVWASIRQEVDPGRTTLWIAEGVDDSYLAQFDGHHLYSVAWDANPAAQLVKWGNIVRGAEARWGDKLWVATAMPGYDDTRLAGQRSGVFRRDRGGGAYYRQTFQGAAQSGADWVIITSFNEWPEGTYIEPSEAYGDFYLRLTGELIAAWKSGAPAPAAPVQPPSATQPADIGGPLLAQAESKQVLQFNPGAALQRRIFADGFVPNSREFELTWEGAVYSGQRAESLASGEVRVYYVRQGDWGAVQWAGRGAAGAGLAGAVLAAGDAAQAIQFNPGAALQRRIFADGFVPNSPEFGASVGGVEYAAQRAENLGSGGVRVYYVRVGDWGAVRSADRP